MNHKQRISLAVAVAAWIGAIICGTEWMTGAGFDNTWKILTLAVGAFAMVASVGVSNHQEHDQPGDLQPKHVFLFQWASPNCGLPRLPDAAGRSSRPFPEEVAPGGWLHWVPWGN